MCTGNKFKGMYYTGDYALMDEDGYFWLLGRSDDVLKVAGHRLSTTEQELRLFHIELLLKSQ